MNAPPVPSPFRLCVVCSTAMSAGSLYRGFFEYLAARGMELTLVVGEPFVPPPHLSGKLKVVEIPMVRAPSPIKDLSSLCRMVNFFRKNSFDVIHLSTPKASLLTALAIRILGGRKSVFLVRGRPYEHYSGLKRRLFAALDAFVCKSSTVVVPISRHLEASLVSEGICAKEKIAFLGRGSSNGIDVDRFHKTPDVTERADALRAKLGLARDEIVALFLGRISHDKGIYFALKAFEIAAASVPKLRLVVAGPDEPREPPAPEVLSQLVSDPRIVRVGWVDDTIAYYAMCDIFLFPTIREGFGNVALEAGSMGLPVLAFADQGPKEAIVHDETGFLAAPYDAREMGKHLTALALDEALRTKIGGAARAWIGENFRSEVIWREMEALLRQLGGKP